MDLDSMLTEAAPARHLPLDGPESPAAVRLYQQITQQSPPPRRAIRRSRLTLFALVGVAAAGAAAAVALTLVAPAAPAHHGGRGATLAAWTVTTERHGLITVTIRQLRDPAGLWQTLREHGVPANVQFLNHDRPTTSAHDLPKVCLAPRMSDAATAGLQEKIMPGNPSPQNGVVLKIRPSAIPHGIGLYLKAWAASPGANGGLSLQIDLVQATPQCTG
jgi:hypothetical protein